MASVFLRSPARTTTAVVGTTIKALRNRQRFRELVCWLSAVCTVVVFTEPVEVLRHGSSMDDESDPEHHDAVRVSEPPSE
jgi:hypothetical protein